MNVYGLNVKEINRPPLIYTILSPSTGIVSIGGLASDVSTDIQIGGTARITIYGNTPVNEASIAIICGRFSLTGRTRSATAIHLLCGSFSFVGYQCSARLKMPWIDFGETSSGWGSDASTESTWIAIAPVPP